MILYQKKPSASSVEGLLGIASKGTREIASKARLSPRFPVLISAIRSCKNQTTCHKITLLSVCHRSLTNVSRVMLELELLPRTQVQNLWKASHSATNQGPPRLARLTFTDTMLAERLLMVEF